MEFKVLGEPRERPERPERQVLKVRGGLLERQVPREPREPPGPREFED